jgi:flagellar L-ring protein precursor FlgH
MRSRRSGTRSAAESRRASAGRAAICAITLSLAAALGAVPLRAQAPPAEPPAPPAPATPPEPLLSSWTSDRVALAVGDVVTVLIDELTLAAAFQNDASSQQRDRDLRVSAAASGSGARGALATVNDVTERESGEARRNDRFTTEMSARVVEIDAGGTLRIEGTRRLRIDDHEQEVALRGWVRPEDVAVDNTVLSWRVADAEIVYQSDGSLRKTGGFWTKIFNLLLP